MEFLDFKTEYLNTLKEFLSLKERKYPGMIYGPNSEKLTNKLTDIEESNPIWIDIIENEMIELGNN